MRCLFLLFLSLLLFPARPYAASWEDKALAAINRLREAPLEVAESLGLSPEEVKGRWGEDFIAGPLPPLERDEKLDWVAKVVLEAFVGGEDPTPALFEAGVEGLGLEASLVGGFCGALSWENFYSLEEAVSLLLQGAFSKALLREDAAAASFLFPGYRYLGLAATTTPVSINGESFYGDFFCFVLVAPPDPVGAVIGRISAPENFYGEVWMVDMEDGDNFISTARVFPDGSFFIPWSRPRGFLVPIFLGDEVPPFELEFDYWADLQVLPVAVPLP